MEETMFLGLRMIEGVKKADFFRKFQKSMKDIYGKQIAELKKQGLLEENEDFLYLTARGISLSNYAMAEFLEPKI